MVVHAHMKGQINALMFEGLVIEYVNHCTIPQ